MNILADISERIGQTPLLDISRLFPGVGVRVLAKLELANPTSIKDRAVLGMIRGAMRAGKIGPDTEVVEASSGNTAIAIASLGAILGYRTRIYMSERCSVERQSILCAYGATVILTPGVEHTRGARRRAMAYCEAHPATTFFLNQHGNPDNGIAHETGTGPEIWEQTGGAVDAVVIGLGTSGTFDGLSRFFKNKNPAIRIVGFEPAASPVYSGGQQGEHHLIGIGPGFVTDNFKRSRANLDEIVPVPDAVAFDFCRIIARRAGVLVGPTSGASAWVAGQLVARPAFAGQTIVCFFYDTGERYLSDKSLFPADRVQREA